MFIKIDYRETDLLAKINSLLSLNPKENITVQSENLPLGDIIISDSNNKEKIIIERKSLADLAASIRDGRYKEQSFRLNECTMHNHNIFYLIEGNLQNYKPFVIKGNSIDKYALLSSLVTMCYYKGFSTYKANNLDESAEWIIQLAYKLDKEGGESFYTTGPTEDKSYTTVLKRVKKNNITTTNIAEIMLSQIPNVSTAVAMAIMEKFHGMKQLIDALVLDKKALNNIMTLNKAGQFRKISKTSIENIYTYLISENN